MVKSAVWITAIGAGVAAVLIVAYMPQLFFPPPEEVKALQSGGQVTSQLAVGETGSFRGLASGGKPPYQFEWAFPDGTIERSMNATHIFTSPGTYEVTVSVSDTSGQTGQHSFEIDVAPAQ
ncbi:MAG TPA: PKD domain-containing protein [Nitrososphaera sp.]